MQPAFSDNFNAIGNFD